MSQPDTVRHDPSCTCSAHPLPESMRVRDARDVYLAENGFTTEGYESATTSGSILGVKIRVPNPPAHQRAIRLHDLVHVATGYGTDHAGEGEISAWQAARGLRGTGAYVVAIILFNTTIGAISAPGRTLAAARTASRGEGSIFTAPLPYDALLELTVGELRALLSIPAEGLAALPRGLHAHAPPKAPVESAS